MTDFLHSGLVYYFRTSPMSSSELDLGRCLLIGSKVEKFTRINKVFVWYLK